MRRSRLPIRAPQPAPRQPPPPPPQPTGLVRMLGVGINYIGTPYELYGCINDVTDIRTHIARLYPMCKDHRILTDTTTEKPTRENILRNLAWLVSDLKPGQNVMFHYSGHGGRVTDKSGDEVTGMDSCIYPLDGNKIEIITDDDIRVALANKIPVGSKCFVVLDSCYSGTAVDLRYMWEARSQTSLSYTENSRYAKTAGQVLFLSASSDTQEAADTVSAAGRPCGALTMALLKTWTSYGTAIKLKYLLWDVRQFLKQNGYSQIPQMTTGNWMDVNGVFDLGRP